MHCSRCGKEDSMALRLDSTGLICCLNCLTRNDFRTLSANDVRECGECGNTDSLWYTRQEDGTDLCLCCKQKQDSHNAMTWLVELDHMFGPYDWTMALETMPVDSAEVERLYAA